MLKNFRQISVLSFLVSPFLRLINNRKSSLIYNSFHSARRIITVPLSYNDGDN